MTDDAAIVPQRCVLVLASTAEFDSRAHRIAHTLTMRGHEVTLVARRAAGLANEERFDGYRAIRVASSASDALPNWLRPMARRLRHRLAAEPAAGLAPRTGGATDPSPADRRSARPAGHDRRFAGVRSLVATGIRLVAVMFAIRAQRSHAQSLALSADMVHSMAFMGVPVGLAVARQCGACSIYDARDIYLDARNLARMPSPVRAIIGRFERGWARAADRVITVNDGYAAVMAGRWQIESPLVVMNCPSLGAEGSQAGLNAAERRFHQRLSLAPAMRVVLYHGGLFPERGIEQLIDAIPLVDAAVLVLMGYGPLAADAARRALEPRLQGRVFVLPAVPPADLVSWVAAADVAAMPIQPSTLNHRLTTPNKLFEAMAAGVPVVASDLPGMAAIVRETGCGVLVDPTDPRAIAEGVSGIIDAPDDVRARYRTAGLTAHRARYNWEHQVNGLLLEYGRLTGRPW